MLKLRRIRIEGFKALDPIELRVNSNILFLIGSNGVGKSSVLQALSFVRAFGEGQCQGYFINRDWAPRDLYPKITRRFDRAELDIISSGRRRLPSRPIRISIMLEGDGNKIFWEFSWSTTAERTLSEHISIKPSGRDIENVFSFGIPGLSDEFESLGPLTLNNLSLSGSFLSIIKPEGLSKEQELVETLYGLKIWLEGITSLELLSPIAMRGGARGAPDDIGPRGELLNGFLASLSAERRSAVVERLQEFYPLDFLSTTRKRAGWVDLQIAENYKDIGKMSPAHMSDGFFRLLALCAVPEFKNEVGLILLDEIEDGIEPHILPQLIKRVTDESGAQFVLTSHSPLLINFFGLEDIAIITRDRSGRANVARPVDLDHFREGYEYLGSGELWINSDIKSISDMVRGIYSQREAIGADSQSPYDRAEEFLGGHL